MPETETASVTNSITNNEEKRQVFFQTCVKNGLSSAMI